MNKPAPWWIVTILVFVFNVISGLVILGFTRATTGSDKLKEEVKKCAPYEYVDKQDANIRSELKVVKDDQQKTIDRIDDNLKEIRSYILKKD